MILTEYNDIIAIIKTCKSRTETLLKVSEKFPDVPKGTIGSIYSQEYQKKMRKTHHLHYNPKTTESYFRRYEQKIKRGKKHVIMEIAKSVELSPALLARMILERYLAKYMYDGENAPRSLVTQMMKDNSKIVDPVLASEINECILTDDQYGPYVDDIKHSIGNEYEFKLNKCLDAIGMAYIGEDVMRERGYDKTPDVKLEVPFAVDGYMVNWVESKASFGDEYNNKMYLKDQFWSYWNRFGPGMVIYWFGFIEELDVHKEKGIILRDSFPEKVTKMEPLSHLGTSKPKTDFFPHTATSSSKPEINTLSSTELFA